MVVRSQPSSKKTAFEGACQNVDGKYVEPEQVSLHDPDLYAFDVVAKSLDGFASVDCEAIQYFLNHGFIAVENAFSAQEVREGLDGLEYLALGQHPGFKNIMFESAVKHRLAGLSDEERLDAIRKMMYFVDCEPRLNAIAYHPHLLSMIRQLIGREELTMFHDMALIKPPSIGREKPWHQDCAYFDVPPQSPIVGVWIALDEAGLDNGCMRVLEGGHREGPQIHFERRDWQICDMDMATLHTPEHPVVAVPLQPGGCMFFSGLLPHGTPHNTSTKRRRALQFHYRPSNTETTSTDERLAVFGSEGKDVYC